MLRPNNSCTLTILILLVCAVKRGTGGDGNMYGYNPIGSDTEWGKLPDYGAEFAEAEVRRGFIRKVFGEEAPLEHGVLIPLLQLDSAQPAH